MTTSFVGQRVRVGTVPVRRQAFRLPLYLLLPWWLLKLAVRLVLAVASSPVAVTSIVVVVLLWAAWRLVDPGLAVTAVVLAASVLVAVRLRYPAFYDRRIRPVIRSRYRRYWIYKHKHGAVMNFANLDRVRSNGTQYQPVLLTVKSTPWVDRVRYRMLAGQVVEDWAKVADRLRQTFGGIDVRVRSVLGRPHEVECWFLQDDPLQKPIEPHPHEIPVRLDALPIGLREDGEVYRLPLLGHNCLFVGEPGSGKSSGIWSIVYQLAPAIADGTVQCIGIDPKAMELAAGEPLFASMAWRDPEDYARGLEDAVLIMRERQASLRGVTRLHRPTPGDPLIVVFVDELAALTLVNDRNLVRRIDNALDLLLSQGRAVGVSVVGAIQDGRKQALDSRDLFSVRAALRLADANLVDLVLGDGAHDLGARCEKILHSQPGVGFVTVDGLPEPIRIRFAYVDDAMIQRLAAGWRPPQSDLESVPEAA